MKKSARIIFAYCHGQPWIDPVSGDLSKAVDVLGHELFIIASGNNPFVHKEKYINLNFFSSGRDVFKFLDFSEREKKGLQSHIDRVLRLQENDSAGKSIVADKIIKKIQFWFTQAKVFYKIIEPDVVIIFNGLIDIQGAYAEAARALDIPLFYAEKGVLPNSWYIDPKGVNALSTIAERTDFQVSEDKLSFWKQKLEVINKSGDSAWEQPQRQKIDSIKNSIGVKESKKVVFFPVQVDTDSNIVFFSPYFRRSLDALRWLAEGLSQEFFILVKPHPKGTVRIEDFQEVLGSRGKVLSNINILDAIEISDCVVSINSTAAFEAAIRAKPVLLLGKGILSSKKFISYYIQGKSAQEQVADCIEHYSRHRDVFYQQALSLGAYLDCEYFFYRANHEKAVVLLNSLIQNIAMKEKRLFSKQELTFLFQEVVLKKISDFSGKVILQAFLGRIREKVFIKKEI